MSNPCQPEKCAPEAASDDDSAAGTSSENEAERVFGFTRELELSAKEDSKLCRSAAPAGFGLVPEIELSAKRTDGEAQKQVDTERGTAQAAKIASSNQATVPPISRSLLNKIRAQDQRAGLLLASFALGLSATLAAAFWTTAIDREPTPLAAMSSTHDQAAETDWSARSAQVVADASAPDAKSPAQQAMLLDDELKPDDEVVHAASPVATIDVHAEPVEPEQPTRAAPELPEHKDPRPQRRGIADSTSPVSPQAAGNVPKEI